MKNKKTVEKETVVAANAAKEELDALRAQQKSTFCPAETLVKQEIAAIDENLASHKDIVHVSMGVFVFGSPDCTSFPWIIHG